MRRKRKNTGKRKKLIFITTAAFLSVSIIIYNTFPQIIKAAYFFTGAIDFSSEPDNYTGENNYDFFNIYGEEQPVTEAQSEEITVSVSSNPGAKPYPEKWNTGSGVISKTTFERMLGEKYIGLTKGGQVKNETEVSNGVLLKESKQLPDFRLKFDGSTEVLIMHTHTTESYEPYERNNFDPSFNYRTTDPSKNVVMVGDKITEQLENAGIGVIHDTTIHDYPSYNGSYERSAVTIKKILKENPDIKVILDIHRDAIGTSENIMQPVTTINGKKAAQVMIISGCDDGTLNMPDYLQNFRFASLFQQQISSDYPTLTRPVLFDYRKYNQDLTTGSLLIEVGNHGNTLEQAEYSGELLGKSLVNTLKQLKE